MNMNDIEEQLKTLLIEMDSGDDEDSDPIDGLPTPVQNAMTEEEKAEKRAEAAAGAEKSKEEIR